MTTKIWQGKAPAVAQVDKIAVSVYDAASQYQLVVNGEIIASTSGAGSAAATVSGLVSGWNAVTGNAYARPITAAVSGTDVKLTADVAGNPFTVSGNVTGGTGTMGTATGITSNAGPNDWNTAANWSGGAVPTGLGVDDAVFRDGSVPVLWGLSQTGVRLANLIIEQTYTGQIGLNKRACVTGAAGAAATGRPEYRDDYLDIQWESCRIGEVIGTGSPAGAGRLKLDNGYAGASTTTVFNTAQAGTDANQPAVRLLAAHASADVLVRNAGGGVGIATDDAGETATVGDVSITDKTPATRVFVGEGVTLTNWTQDGGDNVLHAAADVTLITVNGGALAIEGQDYAVTTLTVKGGAAYPNNVPTGGNAIGTVNVDGGTVDGTRSRAARTWGTVNLKSPGSDLAADSGVVTITTLNEPDGTYNVQVV
jgi:trimeric autotransporter adhesin